MKTKNVILFALMNVFLLCSAPFTIKAQLNWKKIGAKAKEALNELGTSSKTVFDENKDNFKSCYSFLSKYANYSNERAYDNAKEAIQNIALAKATMENLENGIPEGFKEFENKNSEAKSLSLSAKAGYLIKYITKSEEKITAAKKTAIADVEKRVGWIERAQDVAVAERYYKDMTVKIADLEDAFPNDKDVLAVKENAYKKAKEKLGDRVNENTKVVAGYRMPEDNYNLSDKASVVKQMKALCERKFRTEVIKVCIPANKWETRYEDIIIDNRVNKKAYGAIKAFIAYKEGDKFYVHEINFRKDDSNVDFYGFVGRKEIKEENL